MCGYESSLEVSFFTVHVMSLDFLWESNVGAAAIYVGTAMQNRQR